MMGEREMSVISIICSQYWMFPCSVLTSDLTRTVTKKREKYPALRGYKQAEAPTFQGQHFPLVILPPKFLLSKV